MISNALKSVTAGPPKAGCKGQQCCLSVRVVVLFKISLFSHLPSTALSVTQPGLGQNSCPSSTAWPLEEPWVDVETFYAQNGLSDTNLQSFCTHFIQRSQKDQLQYAVSYAQLESDGSWFYEKPQRSKLNSTFRVSCHDCESCFTYYHLVVKGCQVLFRNGAMRVVLLLLNTSGSIG